MLRDARPRSKKLLPGARALAVATVVVVGLFIAGLRAPSGPAIAVAQATEQPVVRGTTASEVESRRRGGEDTLGSLEIRCFTGSSRGTLVFVIAGDHRAPRSGVDKL